MVLIGPAVRLSEYVSASDKRYQAIVRLGARPIPMMPTGKLSRSPAPVERVTEAQFEEAL